MKPFDGQAEEHSMSKDSTHGNQENMSNRRIWTQIRPILAAAYMDRFQLRETIRWSKPPNAQKLLTKPKQKTNLIHHQSQWDNHIQTMTMAFMSIWSYLNIRYISYVYTSQPSVLVKLMSTHIDANHKVLATVYNEETKLHSTTYL